jgi:hypothetical protein
MWLCAACGLAQLVADPTVPEEPRGAEPAALVAQAAAAVEQVGRAGLLPAGGLVTEYGSPHGGSWLGLLGERGLAAAPDGAAADVILDCFGMMHAADQGAALAERAARLAPGGVLLLQYHALATIVRCGQWNALRHGHYAYYSTAALAGLLARHGLRPLRAWQFELYGGTVLLAAGRDGEPDGSVPALLAADAEAGVRDPAVLRRLDREAQAKAGALRAFLEGQRAEGNAVIGYGAASRAVALLRWAGADRDLLPAVADASPGKQGLRLPGTDIPIVSPGRLTESIVSPGLLTGGRPAAAVVLFLSDLLPEVRAAYPEVEASGARWVDAEELAASLER